VNVAAGSRSVALQAPTSYRAQFPGTLHPTRAAAANGTANGACRHSRHEEVSGYLDTLSYVAARTSTIGLRGNVSTGRNGDLQRRRARRGLTKNRSTA